jgi:hypothetical protein
LDGHVLASELLAVISGNGKLSPLVELLLPFGRPDDYCNFAYSALACFRKGMSESASFQRVTTEAFPQYFLNDSAESVSFVGKSVQAVSDGGPQTKLPKYSAKRANLN